MRVFRLRFRFGIYIVLAKGSTVYKVLERLIPFLLIMTEAWVMFEVGGKVRLTFFVLLLTKASKVNV